MPIVIWSFLRPCLQASRFLLKCLKIAPPPLQAKCFIKVRLLYYWTLASQFQYTSTNRWSNFPEILQLAHISPMFPVFDTGNIVSGVQDANYAWLCYTTGNFKKNPSMQAVAKILRAKEQASSHLIFASNSSTGKILICEHFQIEWDHSIPRLLVSFFRGQIPWTNSFFFFRGGGGGGGSWRGIRLQVQTNISSPMASCFPFLSKSC